MNAKDLTGMGVLLLFAITSAFAYNHLSPDGIALFGQWDTSNGVVHAVSKSRDIPASLEIQDPEIVDQIIASGEWTIIDVRQKESYHQGHVPTAVSFPLAELDTALEQIVTTIDPAAPLLIYCSSFECTDSHSFADTLVNMQYTNVKVFSGGFRLWEEAGRKIETNEN